MNKVQNENENFHKHNQLYEQYKQRKKAMESKTEEFYKKYSFSPKINIYNFNMNFFERQEINKQLKVEKEIE